MPQSPFPGMDPFMERQWLDVHHALITYARDQLQSQLPDELMARMQERVVISSEEGFVGYRSPDVHVVEFPPRANGEAAVAVADAVALDEPFVVELPEFTLRETFIEIIDAGSGNRVVTAIEFLSPTNKYAGPGRDEYLRKRDEYLRAETNLVEVDLTRQGPRKEVLPLASIPRKHHATYLICVTRAQPKRLEYYPIPLQSRLPSCRVPLRPHDQDVVLRLQPLIEQAYANGRYSRLDYTQRLSPELEPAEAAWVAERLANIRTSGSQGTTET